MGCRAFYILSIVAGALLQSLALAGPVPTYEQVFEHFSGKNSDVVDAWISDAAATDEGWGLVARHLDEVYRERTAETDFALLPYGGTESRRSLVEGCLQAAIGAELSFSLSDHVLRFEIDPDIRVAAMSYLRRSGRSIDWIIRAQQIVRDEDEYAVSQRVYALAAAVEFSPKLEPLGWIQDDPNLTIAWEDFRYHAVKVCREGYRALPLN